LHRTETQQNSAPLTLERLSLRPSDCAYTLESTCPPAFTL